MADTYVLRWSSQARRVVHIRVEPGNEWTMRNGVPRSSCACGTWDSSRLGDWHDSTEPGRIPPDHLVLCERCLESPRCPA